MKFINTVTGTYPVSLADLRAAHPLTLFPSDFSEEFGDFKPVLDVPMPAHDPLTHRAQEQPPVLSEGSYRQAWEVVALSASEIEALVDAERARLKAAVTDRRWQIETGGIDVAGARVATGIDDQNRITSVVANAMAAGVTTVDFKAASGWLTLTLDDVQGIAAAIAAHVQACFSAERAHHEAIGALTDLAALRAYDIEAGWP